MSDTPRNRVSIVSQCEAWLSEVQAKHEDATGKVALLEASLASIKDENEKRLQSIREKIKSVRLTIDAVLSQDGDATSLEKKEKEHQEALAREADRQNAAREVEKIESELEASKKVVDGIAEIVSEKKKLLGVARDLKESFELSEEAGAIDAPEYETIRDAVEDYLKHVRVDFGITDSIRIDKLVVWQAPFAAVPTIKLISATSQEAYILDSIPETLAWLRDFPGYSRRPIAGSENITSGDSVFIHIPESEAAAPTKTPSVDGEESSEGDVGEKPEWVGSYEHIQGGSIYSPGPRLNHRSGLCFIRTEGRFFATYPNKIKSAKKVLKKETRQVRNSYGYGSHSIEVEVEELEFGEFDASDLFSDFFQHVDRELEAAFVELPNLSEAKTPFALKVRSRVEAIAGTKTQFTKEDRRLNAAEINELVGPYWDAFVNAPWEPIVSGNCAMLKHLCERKLETPHVYSYGVKGHYGLKVRTRDHDWIAASLYCPPEKLSPEGEVSADSVIYIPDNGLCTRRVLIQRCCLMIWGRVK